MTEKLLPGYKALIPNGKGEYLFIEDSIMRGGNEFTFWDIPGGRPEPGESPEQTVHRETGEEVGLEVRVGKRLGTYEIQISKGKVECAVYACETDSFEANVHDNPADGEHLLQARWMRLAVARRHRMSPGLRTFIDHLIEEGY